MDSRNSRETKLDTALYATHLRNLIQYQVKDCLVERKNEESTSWGNMAGEKVVSFRRTNSKLEYPKNKEFVKKKVYSVSLLSLEYDNITD
jgi:hypothetical protein